MGRIAGYFPYRTSGPPTVCSPATIIMATGPFPPTASRCNTPGMTALARRQVRRRRRTRPTRVSSSTSPHHATPWSSPASRNEENSARSASATPPKGPAAGSKRLFAERLLLVRRKASRAFFFARLARGRFLFARVVLEYVALGVGVLARGRAGDRGAPQKT